jgi:hypothetical protein
MRNARPTETQLAWLKRGLNEPGGKLPLFDRDGQAMDARTIKACLRAGWAEPWRHNPLKPDWLICRLTPQGQALFAESVRDSKTSASSH